MTDQQQQEIENELLDEQLREIDYRAAQWSMGNMSPDEMRQLPGVIYLVSVRQWRQVLVACAQQHTETMSNKNKIMLAVLNRHGKGMASNRTIDIIHRNVRR